jgi:hypothetical protein
MADHNLDALVYPMKTVPASRIGGRTAISARCSGVSAFARALPPLARFGALLGLRQPQSPRRVARLDRLEPGRTLSQ